MKTKLQACCESCRTHKFTVGIMLLLSGCGQSQSYPSKEDVSRHLAPGCTLTSLGAFERLPDVSSLQRIVFRYEAACVPDGGKTPVRIRESQQFDQYTYWGAKQWAFRERKYLPDVKADVSVSAVNAAPTPPALPFSDAPECNVRVQRMVDEVLPCLKAQKPELAKRLEELIENHKIRSRLPSNSTSRDAVLLEMENECAYHWRQINRQLPTGSAPGACALKD
jgi:hypothetical protein